MATDFIKCPFCLGLYPTEEQIYKHCVSKHRNKLYKNEEYSRGKKIRKYIIY